MLILLLFGVNLLLLAMAFANADRLRPGMAPPLGSASLLSNRSPSELPTVTVQLPVYNERFVINRLIDACAALNYPRELLDIQVLDDSTDDTAVIAEARVSYWKERGVRILHIRRSDRSGYKAGALQQGLQFSNAQFIAVFDADFVPPPNFLLSVIPEFDQNEIGMVQARWGHLNADESLLTRIQSFGLDTHFAIEQRVRNLTGCFINFNGTAGVWRRACIDGAGGWSADTLAEDLDLSYRAQLGGWKFKFLSQTVAPAELPSEMNSFRAQQFRWTKGTTQTALKMLVPLWKSKFPLSVKLEGTVHLTAHLVFPMILLLALSHAPLLYVKSRTGLPNDLFFALLSIGFLGFVGFFLAQLLAQRELYPDWRRRMILFPAFMAGSMGLAVSNTRAIFQALRGQKSAFVRTPKLSNELRNSDGGAENAASTNSYLNQSLPWIVWVEFGIFVYTLAGLLWLIASKQWIAIPFQALLVAGFGLVIGYSFYSARDSVV